MILGIVSSLEIQGATRAGLSLQEQSWSSSGEEERAPLEAEGRIILNFSGCQVRAQVQLD